MVQSINVNTKKCTQGEDNGKSKLKYSPVQEMATTKIECQTCFRHVRVLGDGRLAPHSAQPLISIPCHGPNVAQNGKKP